MTYPTYRSRSATLVAPLLLSGAFVALEALAQSPSAASSEAAEQTASQQREAPQADPAGSADDAADVATGELRELPELPDVLAGAAAESSMPPVTRLETLLELNRLSDAGRYPEALPLAEQLIDLTEQEFGERSIEAAEAYQTAARIQRDAEQHVLSEESYLHAVDLFRSLDGTYTERAIDALVGLGDNYQAAGQYLNAVTAYNEARTVNRRVFGLLNEGQVPILDRITDTFESLDQPIEADEQQRTILHLAERNYPQGSPEHLEAIYRYAFWLRESGRYHEERMHYTQAMRLIRDVHSKESLLLVRPMREIGNSYRTQRLPDNQGLSSLRSALEILDAQDGASGLVRAEVLRDIGDWDVAFSKVEPDLAVYRTAWTLLGDVEGGDALRAEWFGELESVFGEPISQRGLSRDPAALPGFVIVVFDVDRIGRASDVRIARSEPVGFKDEAVARAVRRWRFRPAIENGEIATRDDVALQFNFRYLPDDQAEEAE